MLQLLLQCVLRLAASRCVAASCCGVLATPVTLLEVRLWCLLHPEAGCCAHVVTLQLLLQVQMKCVLRLVASSCAHVLTMQGTLRQAHWTQAPEVLL